MFTSEVEICNLALASIGELDINSLTEDTKRARLCARYYAATRNHIMAEFDWPFARKSALLVQLDDPDNYVPNMVAYSLPVGCVTPVDITPFGSKTEWVVMGVELHTALVEGGPTLRYTSLITAVGRFSSAFGNILALGLAARICTPITTDKALAEELYARYLNERREAWSLEATVGSQRDPDVDPNNDTFVNGGDAFVDIGNQRY